MNSWGKILLGDRSSWGKGAAGGKEQPWKKNSRGKGAAVDGLPSKAEKVPSSVGQASGTLQIKTTLGTLVEMG